eukprot:127364-Pelagomonas_calceolata.AAC.2
MQFLYGNHVLKQGLGRITENTPAYTGVVVYSMNDIPLGFAVTAKSTDDCRTLDPSGIVAFHQADVGECTALQSACYRVRYIGFAWAHLLGAHVQRLPIFSLRMKESASIPTLLAGEYLRAEDEL